jgi:dynein heavy chain
MIGVKYRFGVFITMNLGYAGRSDLPDNLKSLFRPVAMIIPNYALISEVTLFLKEFKEGKDLSVKMYQLFKLSSEQLSN